MQGKYVDPFTLIVIFGGLGVVLVGLALRQVESMHKNIPIWLFAGLLGILVGGGVTMVAMHGVGYHWTKEPSLVSDATSLTPPSMSGMGGSGGPPPGMPGGMPGMGGAGSSMPGMGGGGGGMPAMGGGGSGGPPARRTLPALVGKIDLVLGGLHLKLDEERAAKLAERIKNLDEANEMAEDDAKQLLDAINDLLTDHEKEMLASFNLPFGGQGGGGSGGGGAGGRGGMGGGGRGGTGGGGGGQASNENPFKQEENAKRLQNLRERFGTPAAETKSGDANPEEKPNE